jgi:hypothetical protein
MLRFSVLSVLLVLGGCAVDVGASSDAPTEGGAAALEGTVGVLEIDRRVEDEGALLTAAFARYQGLAEQDVVMLVSSGARAELDACTVVDGDLRLPLEADVELVDVGALDVRLESSGVVSGSSRLVARTFPDVASVMAGVFYAGEATLPLPQPDRDAYVVRASGGRDIGTFRVAVAAPAEVAVLVYGDEDGMVARDRSLDFSWVPGAQAGAPDVVELELASRAGTIVCTAVDDGAFRIEPALLAQLASDQDAELIVRRVRVRAFDATGLDSAFARVAITRSERVTIR